MAPLCDGRYESPVHQLPLTRARRVAKVVAETFPGIDAPTSALERSRTLELAATGRDAQAGTLAAQLGQVRSPMRVPAAQRAQVRAASCVLVSMAESEGVGPWRNTRPRLRRGRRAARQPQPTWACLTRHGTNGILLSPCPKWPSNERDAKDCPTRGRGTGGPQSLCLG